MTSLGRVFHVPPFSQVSATSALLYSLISTFGCRYSLKWKPEEGTMRLDQPSSVLSVHYDVCLRRLLRFNFSFRMP